jgi:N utilization substance protein B
MSGSSSRNEPKHLARLLAVQYLFTYFQNEKEDSTHLYFEPNSLLGELEKNKYDTKLYESIIDGVIRFAKDIDVVIEKLAPAWPLDQINPINLIILRLAIWEGFIGEITPPKIVIDEAIELDKALSTIESSSFINGVLANIFSSEEIKESLKKLNSNE